MTISALPERPMLSPAEVKWRVDSEPRQDGNEWKARYVAWLPMETLADMLDEWVGPERWWATYEPDGSSMWCQITVVAETGQAVTKADVGDIVGGDLKAATSDSFKRCATRMWGIGREVRQVPTLWAPCRTYVAKGKTVGAPNNQTRPTLDRKLRDMGFAGWSPDPEDGPDHTAPGFVSDGAQPSNPPAPEPDPEIDEDVAERDRLLGQLQTLISRREIDKAEWATWKLKHKGWQANPDTIRPAIEWATGCLAAAGAEPFDVPQSGEVGNSEATTSEAETPSETGVSAGDGAVDLLPADDLTNTGENNTESESGQPGVDGVVRDTELTPEAQGGGQSRLSEPSPVVPDGSWTVDRIKAWAREHDHPLPAAAGWKKADWIGWGAQKASGQ